jgi:alpha-N-acetylglucosaminidase
LIFMVGVLGSANASTAATPQPLRSTEGQGIAQARAILARLGVDQRQITMTPRPGAKPSYRVRIRNGHVSAGHLAIALVHGVAQVLQRQGRPFPELGGQAHRPLTHLPAYDSGEVTSPLPCAPISTPAPMATPRHGGTGKWQRDRLDGRAGVDTPLAMEGQEYVWRALWRENGMDEGAIAQSLSAAPFLPWQRMGNMAGYRAPLSPGWIEKKHQLQIRILGRMRALGMKPVLPALPAMCRKPLPRRIPRRASTRCAHGKALRRPIGSIPPIRCSRNWPSGLSSSTTRPMARATITLPMPSTR